LLIWTAVLSFYITDYPNVISFLTSKDFYKNRVWNFYHYYIGSKYFDELGYFDLYACTFKADQEGSNYFFDITSTRDLYTYELIQVSQTHCPKEKFSEARWEMFKKDISYLQPQANISYWAGILSDRGYNPTPFWNSIGSFLSNSIPLENVILIKLLMSFDLILLLLTFGVVLYSFGSITTLALIIYSLIFFGNMERLVGGFLEFDWFSAILLSLGFIRLKKEKLSALFLAYASVARIFPFFLFFGFLIHSLYKIFVKKKIIRKQFIKTFLLCCIIFFFIGSLSQRGLGAWKESYDNLTLHAYHHIDGDRRLGFKHLFTQDFSQTSWQEIVSPGLLINYEKNKILYISMLIFLVPLWLSILLKRTSEQASILGYWGVFILLILSRYYYLSFAIMLLLLKSEKNAFRYITHVLFLWGLLINYYANSQNYSLYYLYFQSNLFLLLYFTVIGISYSWDDWGKKLGGKVIAKLKTS